MSDLVFIVVDGVLLSASAALCLWALARYRRTQALAAWVAVEGQFVREQSTRNAEMARDVCDHARNAIRLSEALREAAMALRDGRADDAREILDGVRDEQPSRTAH